ncbi:MAG: hypothetical protein AAF497_16135 [Planctomycetota bacterium]
MSLTTKLVGAFSLVAVIATPAFGQECDATGRDGVAPDASLWNVVENPSGQRVLPVINYDTSTGILFADTTGCNGVVDTTSSTEIGGDDVGLIIFLVEGPEFLEEYISGVQASQFGGVAIWEAVYFNGKSQAFGIPAGSEFLDPASRIDLFRFQPGLTPDDFGEVEMGINFEAQQPGATLFGSVQFVPEPNTFVSLLWIFGLLGFRRVCRS